ncbi:MAG: DUF3494 domain-containing protein [Anaerolineae bacterium]|nr:DUF3494 domain-containing protein [Anaerolineae bacterium]
MSEQNRSRAIFPKRMLTQLVILVVLVSLARLPSAAISEAAAVIAAVPPSLGGADSFAVLAATAVTNVPMSAITGNVGLSPAAGTYYAGLAAAEVTGTIYAVDATGPAGSVPDPGLLTTAKTDLNDAYDALVAQACTVTYPGGSKELGGIPPLVPGVYCADAFTLQGVLTLDGADTDVWVFKSATTLITSGDAEVVLATGGAPCEVWWQIGSSASLGTNTALAGNILALTSISLATGANLDGRALARTGAVTMQQNAISLPICESSAVELLFFNATGANVNDTGVSRNGIIMVVMVSVLLLLLVVIISILVRARLRAAL